MVTEYSDMPEPSMKTQETSQVTYAHMSSRVEPSHSSTSQMSTAHDIDLSMASQDLTDSRQMQSSKESVVSNVIPTPVMPSSQSPSAQESRTSQMSTDSSQFSKNFVSNVNPTTIMPSSQLPSAQESSTFQMSTDSSQMPSSKEFVGDVNPTTIMSSSQSLSVQESNPASGALPSISVIQSDESAIPFGAASHTSATIGAVSDSATIYGPPFSIMSSPAYHISSLETDSVEQTVSPSIPVAMDTDIDTVTMVSPSESDISESHFMRSSSSIITSVTELLSSSTSAIMSDETNTSLDNVESSSSYTIIPTRSEDMDSSATMSPSSMMSSDTTTSKTSSDTIMTPIPSAVQIESSATLMTTSYSEDIESSTAMFTSDEQFTSLKLNLPLYHYDNSVSK